MSLSVVEAEVVAAELDYPAYPGYHRSRTDAMCSMCLHSSFFWSTAKDPVGRLNKVSSAVEPDLSVESRLLALCSLKAFVLRERARLWSMSCPRGEQEVLFWYILNLKRVCLVV